MLQERTEPAWIDAFETVLRRCALQSGDTVAILCESQSRPVLPALARLAAARLDARSFTLVLPSVFETKQPVARSTGAPTAIQNIAPVIAALAFPAAGSVNGCLVLAEGDVNLTFKRDIERPITLTIENDYVTKIEGAGVDAELMRSYIAAWSSKEGDRDAYAASHVGYGLNPAARWDSMALYDKRDFNGTELRAFAGNFLYSTGANEMAGRYTQGHFNLPLRHCTIALDGAIVVDQGEVVA